MGSTNSDKTSHKDDTGKGNKDENKRKTLKIKEEQHKKAKAKAALEGKTLQEYVEELIDTAN